MCGGSGGGVQNNRPVTRPVSIEQPGFNLPKAPVMNLNQEDGMDGKRAVPKRAPPAKPPERTFMDRAADMARDLVAKVQDGVQQIGRTPEPAPVQPAPVIPR